MNPKTIKTTPKFIHVFKLPMPRMAWEAFLFESLSTFLHDPCLADLK